MSLYDDVEREARHDWLDQRDQLREPVDEPEIESCPVCGGILEHVIGCAVMDEPR